MKAYITDFNNVLLETKHRINTVRDARDADVLILWQDVRAGMKELCDLNRDFMGKPVVVVQHGRGATRDYLAPNSFPLLADKICVWGEAEAERMERAGYKDKTVITGSPLTFYTRALKKSPHNETLVVYTPIITSHEEPDNIELFLELKKIEFEYAQELLREKKSALKKSWMACFVDPQCPTENKVPYDLLRKNFFLLSKLTDMHDEQLYHGIFVKTSVCNISHIENSMKVLQETDLCIGLEEGTFHLMASALDIPNIIVEGFEYGDFGGCKDYKTEIIRSPATAFCDFKDLRSTIEYELKHKDERQEARREVVSREFDPFPDKDPIELIIDVASELAGGDIRKKEILNGVTTNCG